MALSSSILFRYELKGERIVAYLFHCIPMRRYRFRHLPHIRRVEDDDLPFWVWLHFGVFSKALNKRSAIYLFEDPSGRKLYLRLTRDVQYRLQVRENWFTRFQRKMQDIYRDWDLFPTSADAA